MTAPVIPESFREIPAARWITAVEFVFIALEFAVR